MNDALAGMDRVRSGRVPSPTGAILDSQSGKTTEAGGPRGYDADNKVKGRKRQVLVDVNGRALLIRVQPACVQDRNAAASLLNDLHQRRPYIRLAYADAGCSGPMVAKCSSISVQIGSRPPGQIGFAVQPRRWVVERFFALIGRSRRLAKDYEATIKSAETMMRMASAITLIRRSARCCTDPERTLRIR